MVPHCGKEQDGWCCIALKTKMGGTALWGRPDGWCHVAKKIKMGGASLQRRPGWVVPHCGGLMVGAASQGGPRWVMLPRREDWDGWYDVAEETDRWCRIAEKT